MLAPAEHTLGLAYLKKGSYERAAALLQESIRISPDRQLTRVHLEQARAAQGRAVGG